MQSGNISFKCGLIVCYPRYSERHEHSRRNVIILRLPSLCHLFDTISSSADHYNDYVQLLQVYSLVARNLSMDLLNENFQHSVCEAQFAFLDVVASHPHRLWLFVILALLRSCLELFWYQHSCSMPLLRSVERGMGRFDSKVNIRLQLQGWMSKDMWDIRTAPKCSFEVNN